MSRSILPTSVLALAAVAGLGVVAGMAMRRRSPTGGLEPRTDPPRPGSRNAEGMAAISRAGRSEAGAVAGADFVRPAGPDAMRDPPRKWDMLDETVDESFPASDPPATY